MAKLGDDIEKFVDESTPFLFEKLGDLSALTEHGCLTVAQLAMLVPSILASKKSGDASEIAAQYLQLALLDIAHSELSAKHPETLLPYSQYLRMMESGMYGIDGESLPLPTVDWLVSLEEAERWLQSKDFRTNFDGLRAELAERNTAPAPTAKPAPVVAASDSPEPLPAVANWKMRIQAEATELFLRLLASGANPTPHSLVKPMAQWCRDNEIRTDGNINPSEGYIRTHVLGGGHWTAPTMTREQAKEHVAQAAQVAQTKVAQVAQ